jgi:hypothetical protein
MNMHPGWMLVLLGAVIAVTGLVVMFAPGIPWLGRLPGDIRIENENTRIYVPITTCIVLSLALSAVVWLAGRLWR